jgi:dTDP-4-dehydrorhamnose reductase
MRIFVVGHRGMLGHVVARYLGEQRMEVLTSELKYTGAKEDSLIRTIVDSRPDWIVNAAVKTPHHAASRRELFVVNTQLPIQLKSILTPTQKLIHASTDGVFSGARGNYTVDDSPDAEDDYGISKAVSEIVAEPDKAFVIRCSIVGPDPLKSRGLLAWFMKQTTEVQGFTDHYWNGITTLDWAKICLDAINGNMRERTALLQPGSTTISKFELLKTIAAAYSPAKKIIPKKGPNAVNRTLVPNLPRPVLEQQIKELRDWY